MKSKRQAKLLELIEKGLVASQSDAVSLLEKAGLQATQATVSRDLEEVGAVRERGRYRIPAGSSQYGAPRAQVFREFVINSLVSGNMIVFRTPPGHAGVVAAALDRNPIKGVLGSIAGDDTVFVCTDEKLSTESVLDSILNS